MPSTIYATLRSRRPALSQITSASEIPWRRAASVHLFPGERGVRQVVPASELHGLKRASERGAQVLLGAEHRPHDLELLIGEPDDPHGCPLSWVAGKLGTGTDGNRAADPPNYRASDPPSAGGGTAENSVVARGWMRTATIRLSRTDSTLIS